MAEVIILLIILIVVFINSTISLITLKTVKKLHIINPNTTPTKRTSLLRSDDGYPLNTVYPIKHVNNILKEKILLNSSDMVLIFTSSTCDVCRTVYPVFNIIESKHQNISFVFIMQGHENVIREIVEKFNIREKGVSIIDYEEMDKFGIKGYPFAYYLKNGIVKSKGLINYKEDIDILLSTKN